VASVSYTVVAYRGRCSKVSLRRFFVLRFQPFHHARHAPTAFACRSLAAWSLGAGECWEGNGVLLLIPIRLMPNGITKYQKSISFVSSAETKNTANIFYAALFWCLRRASRWVISAPRAAAVPRSPRRAAPAARASPGATRRAPRLRPPRPRRGRPPRSRAAWAARASVTWAPAVRKMPTFCCGCRRRRGVGRRGRGRYVGRGHRGRCGGGSAYRRPRPGAAGARAPAAAAWLASR
jgi:hypothetical protein